MNNYFDFTGKKILVTGASSGIGKQVALTLAEQGAQVVLVARNQERLEETKLEMVGMNHQVFSVDLETTDDLTSLFENIISDGKKLDGIVHSAGIAPILPLNSIKRKHFEQCMNVNLYSLVEMCRLFSKKKFHSDSECSIVAVSAIAAEYPMKCQTVYAASKGAVNTVVSTLAIELAAKNIRINSIMPAGTNTEMMRDAMEQVDSRDIENKMKQKVKALLEPDEIADEIMFLLSDASRATTGRALYADGGCFW